MINMSVEEVLDEFEIEHEYKYKNKTYMLKNLIQRIKIGDEIFIRINIDNPTGVFFTEEEMRRVSDAVIKRGWIKES